MVSFDGKVNNSFWANKRVFLTGHTGFKGSWISLWLQHMNAHLMGYALKPSTSPNMFEEANVSESMESIIGDIRDLELLGETMSNFDPDIVIHMAAQPLVRVSYFEPIETYETNVMGTLNVLETARKCKNVKALIAVTTDKCYENNETEYGYRETDPMGGHDPYSSSKGCCELLISSFRRSFFSDNNPAYVASARAGNVIGGGDWSKDRLVPDVLKALENSESIKVRNPFSTRPWQHVLEPLSGYLVLAQELYNQPNNFAEAWNFGPRDDDCKSVEWIVRKMVNEWGEEAECLIENNDKLHEAKYLRLDCSKSKNQLQWEPKWSICQALEMSIDWHKKWISKFNMHHESIDQIKKYEFNN